MITFGALLLLAFIFTGVLAGIILSLYFMFDKPIEEFCRGLGLKTAKLVILVWVSMNIVNIISYLQPLGMFTGYIYAVEGSIVSVFQSFTNPGLTVFFILIYLIGYPILIILTYLKLYSLENNAETNYVGSFILILLFSAPFFYFIPVEVVGYYLEAVDPILYEFHPYIYQGLSSIDPLTKALPSLHTGLSVLAMAYAVKYTEKYSLFSSGMAALVIVSTFYLGVHWITDAVLGAFLALISFYLVDSGYIDSSKVPEFVKAALENIVEELELKVKNSL